MSTEQKNKQGDLFGMGAEFADAQSLYRAACALRDRGFKRWDVHSPYPIHGMDEAMGLGRSRVSLISLLGGVTGCLLALVLVFYTGGIDYQIIVHGKPFFAFEPTFPVFFELTILMTAFGTVAGLLVFNLMPRLNHPVFNWERFQKVTDDGFFIVIEAIDPLYDDQETRKLLADLGGTHISMIHHDAD